MDELIKQKLNNLMTFLQTIFPEQKNSLEASKTQFNSLPITLIVEYIEKHILTFAKDRVYLLLKICHENNIDSTVLTDEHRAKLNLYVDFFVEFISHIYN